MKRRLITIDLDLGKTTRQWCIWRLYSFCRRHECRAYRTRNGYHVYIMLPVDVDPWTRMVLRSLLCDDPDRWLIDMRKYEAGIVGHMGTLFQARMKRGEIGVEEPVSIEELVEEVYNYHVGQES